MKFNTLYTVEISKTKHKKNILKFARDADRIERNIHQIDSRFLNRNCKGHETMEDTVQILKGKSCQPRIPYPAKRSLRNGAEIKTSQSKQNLNCDHPVCLEMTLEDVLHTEIQENNQCHKKT